MALVMQLPAESAFLLPVMPMSLRPCSLLAILALSACAAPMDRGRAPAPPAVPAPIAIEAIDRPGGETAAWWFRAGAAAAASRGAATASARNVILFIGDGMSLPTIAAARILEGQRRGAPGEENLLAFEQLPYTALSRTYNTDSQTPDSAGTMTAMITGAKTRMGVLSIGQSARRGDCAAGAADELVSLLEIAQAAGMATGVVTTTRLTHATPAATYAHTPERNWEDDSTLAPAAAAAGCHDIARQFVEPRVGDGLDLALAGGRSRFMPRTQPDPEYPQIGGMRRDGRNLVDEWRRRHPDGHYVWNADQLAAIDPADRAPLLGLFEPEHMKFEHDRPADGAGEPSLAQMTRSAIAHLASAPNGYVLMIEAGRIDHAHHLGNAYRALADTIALSDAVRAARDATDPGQTLIVVTADHSHTLAFTGYPARGNPILGKVKGSSGEAGAGGAWALDALGLPYTTLSYANGPGYSGESNTQAEGPKRFMHEFTTIAAARGGRVDLNAVDTEAPDYLQDASVPLLNETHGGDDVAVYAGGPGAAAFHGSIEQNVIFHILLQATPRLRTRLCTAGRCNADGVPVQLPRLQDLSN
jgi:alkaline phosphatase